MRCEQCQTRTAQVKLHVELNHEVKELHLCTSCYNEVKNGLKSKVGPSLFGNLPFGELFSGPNSKQPPASGPQPTVGTHQQHDQGLLQQLARNLTTMAKDGKIDPVIGRDDEVHRVIEILNRRNKNNPVLIGEPGVGKTAIAEGLALRIVEGKVPAKLLNKQVYVLDVSSLVADTGVRGQFEERMKLLLNELRARPEVMLFIDEIHLLVGAGSAQGSMDAGNILKPVLARGDLQVIGATTLKEYRTIEKDAALERRFQPVLVNEPSVEKTIEILHGIRSKYEEYHQVHFTDEALAACVTLSHRYIPDRHLPDKAIDLLDEAGSKVNLRHGGQNPTDMLARLERVVYEKQLATKAEDYERAAQLRDEEIRLRGESTTPATSDLPEVSVEDIQHLVEEKTEIPVRRLQQSEQTKLNDLAGQLADKVIGQTAAVQKVAKSIRRSRAGLKSANRPIGSFLFAGPTGVGKTELARSLAEVLFGKQDAMIRLDMSEYMEKHSVSKLIGSPPGYVGHDEAGQLTEQVRRHPYSLILLDEIEKAHPDVQHMFLQIMEDGRLTDSQGRTVSFKDCLLIMTSNAGATDRKTTVGFGQTMAAPVAQSSLMGSLAGFFKPEFLNRFDSIIEFQTLSQENLVAIVDLLLRGLTEDLAAQQVSLTCTADAKQKLAELGYHPAFGARPLRRTLQEHVEDKIADLLLDGEVREIQVDTDESGITVNKVH